MAVRKTTKLTKARIEKFPAPDPDGIQRVYWDADLKGFGLLCSAKTSAKAFVVQRENPAKIPRRVIQRLDLLPPDYLLDDVRAKAREWLMLIGEGVDPSHKKTSGQIHTLGDALNSYLERRKGLRESTVREYRRAVDMYFLSWRDKPLRLITREMVETRHDEITAEVKARGQTGHATANSAVRALRLIWNHACDRDDTLPANPVRMRGQWHPEKRRDGRIKDSELPAFWKGIEGLPNSIHRDYLKVILLTGLRRAEAASLRWAEVDLEEKIIRLSGERTKAHRALHLPMSNILHDVFVARRSVGLDGPFVFPSNGKSGHLEEPRFAMEQIAKTTGIRANIHDLRRTYVSVAENCQISLYSLKRLVNHATNDVTSGYVVMEADQFRQAAQTVADRFKVLIGIEPPAAENVIPILSQ